MLPLTKARKKLIDEIAETRAKLIEDRYFHGQMKALLRLDIKKALTAYEDLR